ncbi:MAG: DUF3014 domain-containing protein [Comamonas sp.]
MTDDSRPPATSTLSATPTPPDSAAAARPSAPGPGRAARLVLLLVILVLPVAALIWMGLGRGSKPADALTDGEVARRSTPQQAVDYALPGAVHPVSSLVLPDGSVVAADPHLPRDRDQTEVYVFAMVTKLVGRDAQQQFFPLEDFARRIARTAAELPRHYLPWAFWPVRPAEGRLLTVERAGKTYIAPENAQRYAPLFDVLLGLDNARLVEAYVRAYPLLQKAYASLGHRYAGYYLNDAVVAAIDDLLKTPEPGAPIEVVLPEAGAPHFNASRPWVAYRYADPALESLSVGQKTLLRTGSAQVARVKAKLAELRRLLVAGSPTSQ